MRKSLAQQRASALGVSLYQGLLGELAQIMGGNATALELHRRRQFVKNLEGVGPVTLCFVDPDEVIERGLAILTRGGQLLQEALRAVHEACAKVVEGKGKRGLVAQSHASLLTQAGMDGYSPIHLTTAAEKASQCELDLGGIAIRGGHAREDLSGMIETIVDEVIEADVVITRQTHSARCTHAAT